MKSVLLFSEAFTRMIITRKDGVNFDCARRDFVSRVCINRLIHLNMQRVQENEEISPLARRAALRALLALPEGAIYYIYKEH